VARIEKVERRLVEWADWKRAENKNEWLGTTGHPFAPIRQTDGFAALPESLQATLTAFDVVRGPIIDHLKKVGCPETTIMRRLGRAHLLIADRHVTDRDRDRQEQHLGRITGSPDHRIAGADRCQFDCLISRPADAWIGRAFIG